MGKISYSPYQLSGWKVRVGFLGLAGMIALIVAGRSLGAVTPHLIVSSTEAGPGQTLSIVASKQKADDPVGRVQFYVPNGFTLNSPATGKSVGKATAKVVMRDVDPNSEATMIGGVSAISLTSTSIAYENTSCDGDQHLAAWMVQLKGAKGSTLSFPIFVDATSGASASFGPYVLVACFRPADIAATDPNRSAAGSVVDSFSLALSPFFRPTVDGDYRWRSVWTPFTAGTGTLEHGGCGRGSVDRHDPDGSGRHLRQEVDGLRSREEDRARHDHGTGPRRRRAGWPRPRHDPPRVNLRQAHLARWGEGRCRRWLHDVRHVARAEGVLPGE